MAPRKTTMNLDGDLVKQAQVALGTENSTETVHAALKEVVRLFHMRRLLEWDFGGMSFEELQAQNKPRDYSLLAGVDETAS